MIQRIIGIDFGTSTSAVRVKRYRDGVPVGDRMSTQAVTFDMGNSLVPTLIRKVDKTSWFGYDARNPKRNSVLYQNFKMDLESPNPARRQQAMELTEEFLKYLGDSYRAQSDGGHFGEASDQERTYISYPVKWKDETKQFMLNAARKAGFPDVVGMDEAQAAVLAATLMNVVSLVKNGYLVKNKPSNVLLLDMGAGTSDLVLCRCTPGDRIDTRTLCTWPKEGTIKFGGREVDELLSNYIHSKLPPVVADEVLQRIGLDQFKAWKENLVSPVLKDNQTVNEFSVLDQIVDLTGINILPYSLDRASFETLADRYLSQLPELVEGCLKAARMKGSDVDLVLLTGGHSLWYFVPELLTGTKDGKTLLSRIAQDPKRIVTIPLPQETVAVGLTFSEMVDPLKQPLQHILQKNPTCTATGVAEHWYDQTADRYYADANGEQEIPKAELSKHTTLPKLDHSYEWTAEHGNRCFKCVYCGYVKQRQVIEVSAKPEPIPEPVQEHTVSSENDFDYVLEDNGYVITRYIGHRNYVIMPEKIRGNPIVKIGKFAFARTGVTTVILPESVELIGWGAFAECKSLTSVCISSKTREIGKHAFAKCEKLVNFQTNKNDSIPQVFVLPDTLTFLGSGCFLKTRVKEISLPSCTAIYQNDQSLGNIAISRRKGHGEPSRKDLRRNSLFYFWMSICSFPICGLTSVLGAAFVSPSSDQNPLLGVSFLLFALIMALIWITAIKLDSREKTGAPCTYLTTWQMLNGYLANRKR